MCLKLVNHMKMTYLEKVTSGRVGCKSKMIWGRQVFQGMEQGRGLPHLPFHRKFLQVKLFWILVVDEAWKAKGGGEGWYIWLAECSEHQ